VLVDDVAFVNDPVTFSYTLTGHGLAGKKTRVVLKKKGETKPLASQEVAIGDEGKPEKLELTYTPQTAGDLDLIIEAVALPRESNVKNNSESRHVSVRDEKIRVLLVDSLPRWEFRELKALLEREKTVELKTVLQDADPEYAQEDLSALPHFPVTKEELFQYDVVVFGDVNPAYLSSSVLDNLRDFVGERGRGMLFIAGPYHNPASYRTTALETLLPIELDGLKVPPLDVAVSESFRPELTVEGRKGSAIFRFADSERESQEVWQFLPGFFWMVEARDVKAGAIVYATHPVHTAARGKAPVIVTQRFGNGKVIFHATDELWRWRFRTGDTYYGRYWVHVIRYLSRSKLLGKDPGAELSVDHKVYRTGETVGFRVRFVDEKIAPTASDGVTIVVERPGGTQKKVVLTRVPEATTVFEGRLPQVEEGKYHAWVAAPAFARTPPAEDFEVRPQRARDANTSHRSGRDEPGRRAERRKDIHPADGRTPRRRHPRGAARSARNEQRHPSLEALADLNRVCRLPVPGVDFEEALAAGMIARHGVRDANCGAPMIKTVKIDTDAFERLDHARRGTESFSEVIKRCVPKRRSYREVIGILSKAPVSDELIEAIDESATRRRRAPRRRRA